MRAMLLIAALLGLSLNHTPAVTTITVPTLARARRAHGRHQGKRECARRRRG
jgi:hypothetical protein